MLLFPAPLPRSASSSSARTPPARAAPATLSSPSVWSTRAASTAGAARELLERPSIHSTSRCEAATRAAVAAAGISPRAVQYAEAASRRIVAAKLSYRVLWDCGRCPWSRVGAFQIFRLLIVDAHATPAAARCLPLAGAPSRGPLTSAQRGMLSVSPSESQRRRRKHALLLAPVAPPEGHPISVTLPSNTHALSYPCLAD